jgi:hypothetical protein
MIGFAVDPPGAFNAAAHEVKAERHVGRDFEAGETIIQEGFGGSAATRLDCYALTSWDFRPLVGANGVIGSKLLQRMPMLLCP